MRNTLRLILSTVACLCLTLSAAAQWDRSGGPPGAALPWGGQRRPGEGLIVAPLIDPDSGQTIGGIHASRFQDGGTIGDLVPAVETLSVELGAALRSVRVHGQTLAQQRVVRELALAGQIQASFLPDGVPLVPYNAAYSTRLTARSQPR